MELNKETLVKLLQDKLALCPRFSDEEKKRHHALLESLSEGDNIVTLAPVVQTIWDWEQDRIMGTGTAEELDALIEQQEKVLAYYQQLGV